MAIATGGDLFLKLWDRVTTLSSTVETLRDGLVDFSHQVRAGFARVREARQAHEERQNEIDGDHRTRLDDLERRVGELEARGGSSAPP